MRAVRIAAVTSAAALAAALSPVASAAPNSLVAFRVTKVVGAGTWMTTTTVNYSCAPLAEGDSLMLTIAQPTSSVVYFSDNFTCDGRRHRAVLDTGVMAGQLSAGKATATFTRMKWSDMTHGSVVAEPSHTVRVR